MSGGVDASAECGVERVNNDLHLKPRAKPFVLWVIRMGRL